MWKIVSLALLAFVVRDGRVLQSRTVVEPTRASIAEGWRSLTARPPCPVDDGYLLTFAMADDMVDMLDRNARDLRVVDELHEFGVDPTKLAFVRLSSDPARLFPGNPGALGLQPGLFEDVRDKLLLLGPDPAAPIFDEVELWLGCNSPESAPDETSVSVLFLVGVEGDGARHLILGTVGEVAGERYSREPDFFLGDWMYRAFEVKAPQVGGDRDAAVAASVAAMKLKGKAKQFADCFKDCIRGMCPGLTFIQIACIVLGAAGCIPSGPGYPLCLQATMLACTGLTYGSAAIFCAGHCA